MLHVVLPFAVSICIMAYDCYIYSINTGFLVLQQQPKKKKKKKKTTTKTETQHIASGTCFNLIKD